MRGQRLVPAFLVAALIARWLFSAVPAAAQASATLTLRIIVVASADEAQRLRQRIIAGEDFAAAARTESIDASASAGGLLGRIDVASLRPELRRVLENASPGSTTAVIELPTGFAFLKVEDDGVANAAAPMGPRPGLAATGSVTYVIDVGGLPEAEAVLRDAPKPVDWNLDPMAICQVRLDSLTAATREFEEFFSDRMTTVRQSRPPFEVMQAHLGLGQLLAYQGNLARAVPEFERAYGLARIAVPAVAAQTEEMLGLAHLYKASMDSNAMRAPGDVCLIPPRPGLTLAKTADADVAIGHFLNILKERPDNLEVRWLLNLAAMMVGRYPTGVPAAQLIAPPAFASADDIGRFVDVAPQAGLNVFGTAGGVIVDDLSGSGRLDVMTSNFYSCGPLQYLVNNGDGTFTNRSAAAGLGNQLGGLNIIQTDYNNDGCKDVLVLRGGWETAQRNSLLRNSCHGTFTDVTAASGLARPATSTQTAVWIDIDNDGLLDLFVGNEDTSSQLFLNKGEAGFEDISHAAGVDRLSFAKGVAAGDYDNDGFTDLYVSNYDGPNILYRNNRDRTFSVVTDAGVPGSGRGFATWFFDYDNDGWVDLFATSYFMSADETARTYLGLPHNATTLKLYRNLGDGTFRDVTRDVGLDKVFMPMGANFGDVDNDGFLDIYLGMGTPSFGSIAPHVLLRNDGGRRFVDITASSGTGEIHKGHGIAFADLDNDGDQEIIARIGGATPADSHALRLFENPGQGNHWIGVKLVGAATNRAAVGARVKVTIEDDNRRTWTVYRTVNSGGSFGASPLEQRIGLGRAARIVDLEVWWPTSGTRQHVAGLDADQAIEITEFVGTVRKLERPRVRFGGAGIQ